jgi:pimeloyl-ACP methyl ester carboxylesterase
MTESAVAPAPARGSVGRDGEQSRARYPDIEGFVERDGQRLFYEVYGEGEATVFLLPTWSLVHSRFWKMQIAYFARHFRVLAMDGLGNGRADRCRDPRRYAAAEFAEDCLAVMDASGTQRAVIVGWSRGAQYALELARLAPERVVGTAFIGPMFPYTPSHWSVLLHPLALSLAFPRRLPVTRWWTHINAVHWREAYPSDPTVHCPDGRPRALYVSSPIGLGHAQRDVAIARELRRLHPDLQIDWLAQDPVTRALEAEGERIHPASAHLANESRHFESESAEHDLHCFQALRRMDEIFAANFMLFHDVVRDQRYDLWIGDEAWELDYYLHENPREKRVPFAWLTDFVGFLPMQDGGARERFVAADYNAKMVDHIADHPEVRDIALFVGNPEDIVDERLGPQLPLIRDWTERHFDFTGYVTGFDPAELGDRSKLRAELGYGDDEHVCIVTVGGSGVGGDLLRRVIAAFPAAKGRVPGLRMIVVAGPRIEPASLPVHAGLEVVPYVHNLYRHLAACDLAVVQGGLTTSMELTAQKRPFLYFPLRHHFEQNFHVRHRLERYGAGRRMDFDDSPPERIAQAIADEIGRDVDYLPVETDGARHAARRIAELLN